MAEQKITVRDVANENPYIRNFNYKWDEDDSPARYLSDVLEECGYKFKYEEDYETQGEYNDLKGYYNCEVEII